MGARRVGRGARTVSGRPYVERPPVGLVVEGDGEYASYPSIISSLLAGAGPRLVPRVNAGGIGAIFTDIGSLLDDLVSAHKPVSVIVTYDSVDSIDRIFDGDLFKDCVAAKLHLEGEINAWLSQRRNMTKFEPLPEYIAVVVQCQKFETWMALAGCCGAASGLGPFNATPIPSMNGDILIGDPVKWIAAQSDGKFNSKVPARVKELFSSCDPSAIVGISRSFSKLAKEIKAAMLRWTSCVDVEQSQAES